MSSFPAYDLHIQNVRFGDGVMLVDLDDGRTAVVRYEDFPRLRDATEEQRRNWELIGRGVGIHWPAIDEDISAEGFVRNAMDIIPPVSAATG